MPIITIPAVDNQLTLEKPWTFELHDEERNHKLWDLFLPDAERRGRRTNPEHNGPAWNWGVVAPQKVTLPAGTRLRVRGLKVGKIDAILFQIIRHPASLVEKLHFWALHRDVNMIEGVWDESTISRSNNYHNSKETR